MVSDIYCARYISGAVSETRRPHDHTGKHGTAAAGESEMLPDNVSVIADDFGDGAKTNAA
jgi:hypothetical protein